MDKDFIKTTVVTVAIALLGYFATYLNDVHIMNRKEKLDRVNRQLKDLYGPLLSLTSSTDATWKKFRSVYRPNMNYFDNNNPPTEEEKKIWRNWMLTVFIPINKQIYDTIINNTDLIIEDQFPKVFKDFCAHEETYRPVIERWKDNDFSDHTGLLNYPDSLNYYAQHSYNKLKEIQNELLED